MRRVFGQFPNGTIVVCGAVEGRAIKVAAAVYGDSSCSCPVRIAIEGMERDEGVPGQQHPAFQLLRHEMLAVGACKPSPHFQIIAFRHLVRAPPMLHSPRKTFPD
jgi:hypothetical protein